ncbi:NUDIX domain-containing protein [Nocardia zapadnayensis]|uniref:NUDIX domain-containing protein n=1 Tax=Nocardia rhamnosiphila TaxID=426716 RepID=UPI002248248F|nr:NUDIX domain-containing protein [Nocardia zapadnayensis]MCX0275412.1 NUDIX domain-containing protein [Nocardia zapadnayensis]
MCSRHDYYRDPDAPEPNSSVPGGSALVVDYSGAVLMQRRRDSGNWSFPGGVMEIGETLEECVIHETKEETGLDIEITGLLGIYTDPQHLIAYADGEVRQKFNITYYGELAGVPIHDTVRLRLRHHTEQRDRPYLG